MFNKLGRSNGAEKFKYRSIMFNLKYGSNMDSRRRVLLRDIEPKKLIIMISEKMVTDERKLRNKKIQEKALFECERRLKPSTMIDQFKCGKCGQKKCTYYHLQTRSADEPMTMFVTYINCNNHWKFCYWMIPAEGDPMLRKPTSMTKISQRRSSPQFLRG